MARKGWQAPRSPEALSNFRRIHRERAIARFWSLVVPDGTCLTYTGKTTKKGYARIKVGGRMTYAHRLAYELVNGPIPGGLDVLHRCDNPPCVNYGHLYAGTNSDNIKDRMARGRSAHITGASHPSSKLTAEQVLAIRTRYAAGGISQPALGREYDISQSHVGRLIHRQSWPDE